MVICLKQGADDLHIVWLMPLPLPSSLAQLKSDWCNFFWCRLPILSWKTGH